MEILLTLIGEYFVTVFVVDNYEHLRVAILYYLFGLSEETTFLDVEYVVFFLGFLVLDVLLQRFVGVASHRCIHFR